MEMMGLLSGPLLVRTAVAGPNLHRCAIGSASTSHVEAEAGRATNDGAIRIEGPLLVRAVVTVGDLCPGARRCGACWYLEALVAIYLQFAIGQGGPLLVRAAVAVPDAQQRAVGGGCSWYIQASIRSHAS